MLSPPYEEQFAYVEQRIDALKTDKTGDERQTEGEVFDRKTLMTLYDMMKRGMVDKVHYPVSTGKEGNVFYSTDGDGSAVALKIYRTSTSTFKRVARYVEGDPRFKGTVGNRWKLIYAWAAKEYRNLERYAEAGLRVPEPITVDKNCLLMEYIGDESGPAPQLRNYEMDEPADYYECIVEFIVDGWNKARLVHGDLSEYNILVEGDGPVVIDVGQTMTADFFNARELLERDVENVNAYFRRKGVDTEKTTDVLAECKAPRREGD